MSIEQRVRAHFDADASRFDAIYEDNDKGFVARWIDRVWRGVVRRRLELTLQLLQPLAGKTILDVGCGSGRYCLAYAEGGAARVVGIDFAGRMIDLAKEAARRRGLADRCEFRIGAFPDDAPNESFDVSTALGFFDYVADPVPLLKCMRKLTRQTIVMSFPKAREWRIPLRRLRFLLNGCPLFLYTEARVKGILEQAGLSRYDWISLDRDYLVAARP